MPSCPENTNIWRIDYEWRAPISELFSLQASWRAKMPSSERHNDLFAGKTHFQSSSVPSQQHRLCWQGIIILQSIIQSPPEPSNCMLQLIEVLIRLSESLQFFYCTEAWMVKNLSWAKTDNVLFFFLIVQWYRENLILLFSYHTHTHRHLSQTQPCFHHISSRHRGHTV